MRGDAAPRRRRSVISAMVPRGTAADCREAPDARQNDARAFRYAPESA